MSSPSQIPVRVGASQLQAIAHQQPPHPTDNLADNPTQVPAPVPVVTVASRLTVGQILAEISQINAEVSPIVEAIPSPQVQIGFVAGELGLAFVQAIYAAVAARHKSG